ncbi:MAG: ROK family protein [Vicinamibacterales bacterium]|nr:fructokinase [Acidobacteriota bacterium]MDP7295341.1 ROK family protein [Vicinamibacterales bacterium]MDP7473192.1 ROK family protein [Vicinamibacterales bacterium]MDP7673091.1 ROK family protein [Vicinamibacterales bacterium]HJO38315.1 ROK family protein [Vicinamibacterales bacterium]
MGDVRIGVDLGGTKIEAIALGADGATLARQRVPTPRDDYDATLQAIVDLIASIEREAGTRGTVGLGIPGAISPATGVVKNANSTWINGRTLAEDLAVRLDRPLRFDNDANCFALSEATDGGGAGAKVVFGVIIGTGTGGGLVIDGRPLVGANAIGGEWGHNPLPWPTLDELPGPPCYCGRTGCLETFLSGPGLSRDYAVAGGTERSASEIARMAADGDPAARAAVERHADRLARGLATVINLVDPDVVVLGGGLSNLDGLYTQVPELWTPYVFSDRVDTRLVRPVHGDSSGVRGAAWLWAPTV